MHLVVCLSIHPEWCYYPNSLRISDYGLKFNGTKLRTIKYILIIAMIDHFVHFMELIITQII